IYRTNLSTSYAAGRLAQLKDFPLWVYKHSGAEHPRLQHKAWNGLTLPADHPFWQTHYPPNGWGCGCRVVGARSLEGAARLGGDPRYTEPPAGWDERDGKGRLPGIDDGWDYMPGGSSPIVEEMAKKVAELPEKLGDALRSHVLRYIHPSDMIRFEQAEIRAREAMLKEYLGDYDYEEIRIEVMGKQDKRLTLVDKIAINAYTRNNWFRELNDALKVKTLGRARRYLKRNHGMIVAMDAALDKLPNYRGEVRRGLSRTRQLDKFKALKPGDVLQFNSYLSTTWGGSPFSGDVQFVIQARTAKKVDHLSHHPGELEAIIPRGRQFEVERVEHDDSGVIIYMRELAPKERRELLPTAYMRREDG
ncbi:MAG: ADP-ribosyltransferase domain-containing protein, partial [Rhodocyclaceae bacterium]|nr:ADP-ribosyltransferase domain-containing protein [Rhodocyclaceae bacterium]